MHVLQQDLTATIQLPYTPKNALQVLTSNLLHSQVILPHLLAPHPYCLKIALSA